MRVLLISAEYPPTPGGVGDYTALLAAHLADAGATVSILTSGTDDTNREGDVTVYRCVARWGWGVAAVVRGVMQSARPDVVHLQYQTGMYGMHPAVNFLPDRLSGRLSITRRDIRFVTTFHDLRAPYLFPKAGPLRAFVMRHLARTSDIAIATNGADQATLARWGAHDALVPIGSNIPVASCVDTASTHAHYGIPDGATLLTTFGLLNHSKGVETVVNALTLLKREGINVRLLLVGAGTGANDPTNQATTAAFDAQCAAAGMEDVVVRTGTLPADDVASALAASVVCLLPYRDGASPRRGSLLAALTQGIPVVTTMPAPHVYDGLPAPRDGDTAMFVAPGDRQALAGAVRRIMADGALASRLRAGAVAYAAQFAWPTIAARTVALYAGSDASQSDSAFETVTAVRR